MFKYYVYDETFNAWSPEYDTLGEAREDLDNYISYLWSEDAVIERVNVNDGTDFKVVYEQH